MLHCGGASGYFSHKRGGTIDPKSSDHAPNALLSIPIGYYVFVCLFGLYYCILFHFRSLDAL